MCQGSPRPTPAVVRARATLGILTQGRPSAQPGQGAGGGRQHFPREAECCQLGLGTWRCKRDRAETGAESQQWHLWGPLVALTVAAVLSCGQETGLPSIPTVLCTLDTLCLPGRKNL
jgi:hypothetical protein